MGSSLCGAVNRKQEVSNIGCWALIAWRSLSLIAWRPSCATVPTVVGHPFLLFSSLFSSFSIRNSKVLFTGHLFIVFVTCEKLLMRLRIIKVMRKNMRLRIVKMMREKYALENLLE